MKKTILSACLSAGLTGCFGAALLAASIAALAAPVDLATWAALGDTQASAASAKLSTAFVDEAPLGSGALDMFSLESALGTVPGTLGGDASEGSALVQTFTVAANATVSFNWALNTDSFDAGFADLAFVLIDGVLLQPLGTVAATEVTGSFSYNFTAGAHSLAFGLVDVNDFTGVSTLSVTNADVTLVPEPGSLALLLAGVGILATRSASGRKKAISQA